MARLVLALALIGSAWAQTRWLPGEPARVRALGGCFAALSLPTDAHLFNPAGLASHGARPGWRLELDPTAAAIRPVAQDGDWDWAESLPLLLPLRRAEWRGRRLALSLTPATWLPAAVSGLAAPGETAEPPSGELVPSLSVALALDSRVRLGVSAAAWLDPQRGRRAGVSYGAVVRANRIMDVGGQALYLPAGALDARRPLDQLGDGTINVGVACYPLGRDEGGRRGLLLLALDVRNVTQESGLGGRQELHLGVEGRLPGGLDLRGGVFWPNRGTGASGVPCVGGGLGWVWNGPPGGLRLDLAWLQNPAEREGRLWTGGLRWPH
jgi:hypothetical protein